MRPLAGGAARGTRVTGLGGVSVLENSLAVWQVVVCAANLVAELPSVFSLQNRHLLQFLAPTLVLEFGCEMAGLTGHCRACGRGRTRLNKYRHRHRHHP